MGAIPYRYVVKYQPDIDAALQELREREFKAGRYNPAMPYPLGFDEPAEPAPGAQHASIADALIAADAEGTRSILDLFSAGDTPGFAAAPRLPDRTLEELFATTRPTREVVEQNSGFYEGIERGQGIYIILYKGDQPDEILFAGYSYD